MQKRKLLRCRNSNLPLVRPLISYLECSSSYEIFKIEKINFIFQHSK
jgi:hypothetical protein